MDLADTAKFRIPFVQPLEFESNKYLVDIGETKYASKELLEVLFNNIHREINLANEDRTYIYTSEIGREDSLPIVRIYCNKNGINMIAARIFLTFHKVNAWSATSIPPFFERKEKYDVTIMMSKTQDQFPKKISGILIGLIKRQIKPIKKFGEFKGKIHKIKV